MTPTTPTTAAAPAGWALDCGCRPWTGDRCPEARDLWNRHRAAHLERRVAFARYEATGCRSDTSYQEWQAAHRHTDTAWADYCAHLGEPIDDREGVLP